MATIRELTHDELPHYWRDAVDRWAVAFASAARLTPDLISHTIAALDCFGTFGTRPDPASAASTLCQWLDYSVKQIPGPERQPLIQGLMAHAIRIIGEVTERLTPCRAVNSA